MSHLTHVHTQHTHTHTLSVCSEWRRRSYCGEKRWQMKTLHAFRSSLCCWWQLRLATSVRCSGTESQRTWQEDRLVTSTGPALHYFTRHTKNDHVPILEWSKVTYTDLDGLHSSGFIRIWPYASEVVYTHACTTEYTYINRNGPVYYAY